MYHTRLFDKLLLEKVHIQSLTKENRHEGGNHSWTEKQNEAVKTAVDDATQQCPTMSYAKATEILRAKHTGMLGEISKDQVRNIYKLKVERSGEPAKAPVADLPSSHQNDWQSASGRITGMCHRVWPQTANTFLS